MDKFYEKDAAGPGGEGRGTHDALDLCVREFSVRAVSDAPTSPDECWVDVIASTDAIDSYDEIVEQSWDLKRFLANPVILWAHQSRELPIGRASNVGVVDGKLQMRIHFCDAAANPMGPQVYAQYKGGFMRAVSVGFYPRDVRVEVRDGREMFVLANNVLIECSCTPIGANPEALAKSHARIKAMATRTASDLKLDQSVAGMSRLNALKSEMEALSKSLEKLGHGVRVEVTVKESPGAERAIATENNMDEKQKAALDAANSEREAAVKRASDAEKALADERAKSKRLTGSLVKALVEAGRFAKDEIEEQTELAEKSFDLFERLAAKRAVRGAEFVGAKGLPAAPEGGAERALGDGVDDGGELAALARK